MTNLALKLRTVKKGETKLEANKTFFVCGEKGLCVTSSFQMFI